MPKSKVLLQLDTDAQASVFDAIVAIDCEVDQLLRHGGATVDNVRPLVYGTIFTRSPADLRSTAIFIGGSDVVIGEAVLSAVTSTFFGPMRVSVMMDSNGANTTAAAAVLAAGRHVPIEGAEALVLGATGAVGQRVTRLLAGAGARVRVGSRDLGRAQSVCNQVGGKVTRGELRPYATGADEELKTALHGVEILVAAGSPGVTMATLAEVGVEPTIRVAIDLNAVPPLGIEGVRSQDRGEQRVAAFCYGALGVGGIKMKIHKAAVRQLFQSSEHVLDAEEIFRIGQDLKILD